MTSSSAPSSPPIAEKREHSYTHHGITISDPYDWLYDKSYPTIDDEDVLDYVKAENAYFEAQMKPFEAQTEALFQEMPETLLLGGSWRLEVLKVLLVYKVLLEVIEEQVVLVV